LGCDFLDLPEVHPDDDVSAAILRQLAEDPRCAGIERYTLTVEVQGGVARLGGHTRTAELKRAAEDLAASVPGVVAVDDRRPAEQLQVTG
jgi:osmotically-inducible protein OsmY